MIVKRLAVIITFLLTISVSYGQEGTRECGSTHYSLYYIPTIINSLSDLPTNIQDSIKDHLLDKLGDEFYEMLIFESCLVIDYQEFVKQDPKVLDHRWHIPKYDLGFYICQKQAGIDYCCSRMTLDSNGIVIDSIKFPGFKMNPLSTTFSNFNQIKKTAKKNGFNPEKYSIDFIDDHIVFIFTNVKTYKYIEYLHISAHTGQKVRQYRVTGLIDWN